MIDNSYKRLENIISEMDYIFKKGRYAIVKANNYTYIVSNCKISGKYIMLYFGRDFLDAYHYMDIKEISEFMEG